MAKLTEVWQATLDNNNPCPTCGHPWQRHIDGYDSYLMSCKYCGCDKSPPGLASRRDKIEEFKTAIISAKMAADKVLTSHNVRTGYDMAIELKALAARFEEALRVMQSESDVFVAAD